MGAPRAPDRAAGALLRRGDARHAVRLHPLLGRPERRRRPLRAAHHAAARRLRPHFDGRGDQARGDALQPRGADAALRTRRGGLHGVYARADDPLPAHALPGRHDPAHRSLGDALLRRDLHERPQALRRGRALRLRHPLGLHARRAARRHAAVPREVRGAARSAPARDARHDERLRRLRQRRRADPARTCRPPLRPHRGLHRPRCGAGGRHLAAAERLRPALQGARARNGPREAPRAPTCGSRRRAGRCRRSFRGGEPRRRKIARQAPTRRIFPIFATRLRARVPARLRAGGGALRTGGRRATARKTTTER